MPRITFSGNTQTPPTFIGDFLSRDYLLAGGVKVAAAGFNAYDAVVVTVDTGGAAQAATEIPVVALTGPIPVGTTLTFAGGTEFATLTAAADEGDDTLTVTALVNAVEAADTATYPGTSGKKRLVAGSRIGRTFTERDAGTAFGPAADADDEIFIVAYDIYDLAEINDAEVLRGGTLIKENFLPGWAAETTAIKAKVRAKYQTTLGAGGAE
jgi:hypothetical protein